MIDDDLVVFVDDKVLIFVLMLSFFIGAVLD